MSGARPRWLRAVAPPVLVGAVIAAVAVATSGAAATATPNMPPKTTDQLLAMIGRAAVEPVHGTLVLRSALGLPSLPSTLGGASSTGLLGLATGTHSLRVWEDGHGRVRLQTLDQLDETDVVVTGGQAWGYTYSTNAVTELRLGAVTAAAGTAPTPDLIARALLSEIGESTDVNTTTTARVAGRNAYRLDVEPLTAATTIGRISIDVDANTGVPLRVRIFATGATSAALSVGFSSVSFAALSPSVFTFTPPPRARLSNLTPTPGDAATGTIDDGAYTIGSGWASVLVLPHAQVPAKDLAALGQPVDGGTLISTTLVNVMVTDDARVLVGFVPASTLQAASKDATSGR